MTFIIGTFQFHCKIEHKQAKRKIPARYMRKSDRIFPCLKNSALFKSLL